MSDYIGEASVKITGDIKPLEQAVNQAKQLAGKMQQSFKGLENFKINVDGKSFTGEQWEAEQKISAMNEAVAEYADTLGILNEEQTSVASSAEQVNSAIEKTEAVAKTTTTPLRNLVEQVKEFGYKAPASFYNAKEAIENAGRVGRTALIALGAAMTALAKGSLDEYAKYSESAKKTQDELNEAISKVKAGFGAALQPIKQTIAGLAEWASQNQQVVNGILTFATVLGGSVGLIALVTKLKTALKGLGTATGGIIGLLSALAGVFVGIISPSVNFDKTLAETESDMKALTKASEDYNKALADMNEEISEAQKAIAEAREDYLDGLKKILVTHEETVAKLTQQIEEANYDYKKAVDERNAEFIKSQAKEEKAHQDKVDELMTQLRFLQRYNNDYNKEKLAAVQFALRREEVLYQKQTEAEQKELELRNQQEKEKLDKRLAEYQKELNKETAFLNKHRDDLNAVRDRILLDEKEYLDKQYAQQVASYNRQVVAAQQKGKEAADVYHKAYIKHLKESDWSFAEGTTPSGQSFVGKVVSASTLADLLYQQGWYADGGYTGAGGKDEVAGIVHRGEYVLPQEMVDQTTGTPKAMGNNITINLSGTFATSDSERRKVAQQIVAALEQTNYARLGA